MVVGFWYGFLGNLCYYWCRTIRNKPQGHCGHHDPKHGAGYVASDYFTISMAANDYRELYNRRMDNWRRHHGNQHICFFRFKRNLPPRFKFFGRVNSEPRFSIKKSRFVACETAFYWKI